LHGAHVSITCVGGAADVANVRRLCTDRFLSKHGAGLASALGGVARNRDDISDFAVFEDHLNLYVTVTGVVGNIGAGEGPGDATAGV